MTRIPSAAATSRISPIPAVRPTERIDLLNAVPILVIHGIALAVVWVGWSWTAVWIAIFLFWFRMFVITAFYHRYFSHRTFKTHRVTQFIFALLGTSTAQRSPLWWAAHHREHHRHSDEEADPHSPGWRGALWSHAGWFLTDRAKQTNWRAIPDWKQYPELVWLDRFHLVGPLGLAALLALLGSALALWAPQLETNALQLVVWGFGVSTTALYHATFTVNSVAHMVGTQRFETGDDSRNNWFLAVLTLGEGWHNNHHYCPGTVRQGFYWWEFDPTYWILRAMSAVRLVWDLNPIPPRVYEAARLATQPPAEDARGES